MALDIFEQYMWPLIDDICAQAELSHQDFAKELGVTPEILNQWITNDLESTQTLEDALIRFCVDRNISTLWDQFESRVNKRIEACIGTSADLPKDMYILYHVSKYGPIEQPLPNSMMHCDFGKGFYLGSDLRETASLLCGYPSSRFYLALLNLREKPLKIQRMCNHNEWAELIAFHHGRLEDCSQKYRKMESTCDLIIGDTADGSLFYALDEYIQGKIPDGALKDCLDALKPGKQYACISDVSCQCIDIGEISEVFVPSLERKYLEQLSRRNLQEAISQSEQIIKNHIYDSKKDVYFADTPKQGKKEKSIQINAFELKQCDFQGKLFALTGKYGYDSVLFFQAFMNSETAVHMDSDRYDPIHRAGEAYLLDALQLETRRSGTPLQKGASYSQEVLYWLGFLCRYWHFYRKESSKQIYKKLYKKDIPSLYLTVQKMETSVAVDHICNSASNVPCNPESHLSERNSSEIRCLQDLTWENSLKTAHEYDQFSSAPYAIQAWERHRVLQSINIPPADPHDKILLNINGRMEEYPATVNTLKFTLDRFLFLYERYRYIQTGLDYFNPQLSEETREAILNRSSRSDKETKKTSVVWENIINFQNLIQGEAELQMPQYAHACYLNRLLWDFCSDAKTTILVDPIKVMGTLFPKNMKQYKKKKEIARPAPLPFEIEDYMEHERITSFSLMMEITAILLEYSDIALREKAWDGFLRTIKYNVFRSKLYFTRIAVARMFFRQILLEAKIAKYKAGNIDTKQLFSDEEWEDVLTRASSCESYLNCPYDFVPDIDESINEDVILKHLYKLLGCVEYPVNFTKYGQDKNKDNKSRENGENKDNDSHPLAPFCNPSHKNMDSLLKSLSSVAKKHTRRKPKNRAVDLFTKLYNQIR